MGGLGSGSVATATGSGSVDPCSAPPAQVTAVVINPTGEQQVGAQAQEPEQGLGSTGVSGDFHFYPAEAGATTLHLHRYGTSWFKDLAVGKKLFIEHGSDSEAATENNAVAGLVIYDDNTSMLTLAQPLISAFPDGKLQSYD